ncbi:MAG: PIN domain-containing protein [Flavobacteriales bacterium]
MRRAFVDANVALDMLAMRQPFAEDARLLFDAAKNKRVELLMASLSFITIHYLVCRSTDRASALHALQTLKVLVTIAPVDSACIELAITSPFVDFEDAVQYHAAIAADAVLIITRDEKGFKRSRLPVMTPRAFLRTL